MLAAEIRYAVAARHLRARGGRARPLPDRATPPCCCRARSPGCTRTSCCSPRARSTRARAARDRPREPRRAAPTRCSPPRSRPPTRSPRNAPLAVRETRRGVRELSSLARRAYAPRRRSAARSAQRGRRRGAARLRREAHAGVEGALVDAGHVRELALERFAAARPRRGDPGLEARDRVRAATRAPIRLGEAKLRVAMGRGERHGALERRDLLVAQRPAAASDPRCARRAFEAPQHAGESGCRAMTSSGARASALR